MARNRNREQPVAPETNDAENVSPEAVISMLMAEKQSLQDTIEVLNGRISSLITELEQSKVNAGVMQKQYIRQIEALQRAIKNPSQLKDTVSAVALTHEGKVN
jgi:phage shock protein A